MVHIYLLEEKGVKNFAFQVWIPSFCLSPMLSTSSISYASRMFLDYCLIIGLERVQQLMEHGL